MHRAIEAALQRTGMMRVQSAASSESLYRRADGELDAWGHQGHQITLERAKAHFADPSVLRCVFWCDSCHVAQVVLLGAPGPGEQGGIGAVRPAELGRAGPKAPD